MPADVCKFPLEPLTHRLQWRFVGCLGWFFLECKLHHERLSSCSSTGESKGFGVWDSCSLLLRVTRWLAGEACTIVLRGGSEHGLEEAERSLHDALAILSQLVLEQKGEKQSGLDTSYFPVVRGGVEVASVQQVDSGAGQSKASSSTPLLVCGGGASEMAMAAAVEEVGRTEAGKVVSCPGCLSTSV